MKIFVIDKNTLLVALIAVCIVISLIPLSMAGSRPSAAPAGDTLPIYSVETEEKKVAVTFNAAWGNEDIDSILNTLTKFGAKCTFFIVGTWAEKYPESVKKIQAAGHEIASHGYDHSHYAKMTVQKMAEDMDKAKNALKKITGKDCTLFRAPYGEYTEETVWLVRERGEQVIQWNIDSLDYKNLTEKNMSDRIMPRLANGAILLFHTGTENTAKSLPGLLQQICDEGYGFTTVGELIYDEPYRINHEGRQIKEKKQEL